MRLCLVLSCLILSFLALSCLVLRRLRVQINAGKIPGFLSGDREVLEELINNPEMTPAMASTFRVLNLLTSSAGYDAGKVRFCRC